ncbi:MAG: Y-family DNA polymerase [Filimonas sp.]|nr:Y-family DNA polymerase [Filimonas sp.]
MKAIVDCNSFYCSCERVFRPDLWKKPVVVLSNNDGCIVSRSDEAKQLGVEMAGPFFQAKPLIDKYNVATFSSNYNLYGDMSWRVMETLRAVAGGKDKVEVYSVDEAFIDLKHVPAANIPMVAKDLKLVTEEWTGIQVSVGVAPTKVLAKVANNLAKKDKLATNCILVLDTEEKINAALQQTPVLSVWGVGRRSAMKLRDYNVFTAYDLKQLKPEWVKKYLGGVVGTRLLKELNGEEAIVMEDELEVKKMIATTRMFGAPVHRIEDVKEAVATYVSRCAEKLRRQRSAAGAISVFVVPREPRNTQTHYHHGPMVSDYAVLSRATSFSNELIVPALKLVDRIFEHGKSYKKAGVIVSHLIPEDAVQGDLFVPGEKTHNKALMQMMDNINFSMRDDILKFAAAGTTRNWKMRQEYRSNRYTTRWEELYDIS